MPEVAAGARFKYDPRAQQQGTTSHHMFEIVKAGGIVMVPIILCSILAVAITLERLWTLRGQRVVPGGADRQGLAAGSRTARCPTSRSWRCSSIRRWAGCWRPALPTVIATAAVMIEAIEDAGRHVVHDLERYLNTLGTIAAISPLLGLLGTVTGMIRTFKAITLAASATRQPWLAASPRR